MSVTEVVTIAAIIIGPILAVQAQKWIERITRVRHEKKQLFVTLMATRGRVLHQDHVQALNMIDIVFRSKGLIAFLFKKTRTKELAVLEAWAELRDALFNAPAPPWTDHDRPSLEVLKEHQPKLDAWTSDCERLRNELLEKMAEALGYHFDPLTLRKGAYNPKAYADIEFAQIAIMEALKRVALGSASIPIHIAKAPDMDGPPIVQSTSPTPEKSKKERNPPS